LTLLWNDLRILPVDTLISRLDWFVTSDWTEPPARCRKATIVHDLAFRRFPETIDPKIMSVFTRKLGLVQRESRLVFADSISTGEDLEEFYGIPSERIRVVYPGVDIRRPESKQIEAAKHRYGLTRPYFLSVGKIEPRKNLKRLIEAYAMLGDIGYDLAIAGPAGWDTVTPVSGVSLLGFVPDADLYALYAGATALVYPSLWEGFGYPAVEAMAIGTPVALSNRSSLGEIGADAALLFDPEDPSAIMNAMKDMATNAPLRTQLSLKGIARAATYSWKSYAKSFLTELSSAM
jgi:glycosyltransferase involved in cell wall biosynthesis